MSLDRDFLEEAGALCPVRFADIEAGRRKVCWLVGGSPRRMKSRHMGQAFAQISLQYGPQALGGSVHRNHSEDKQM